LHAATRIARGTGVAARFARLRVIRQPKAGQRHSGQADAEFLQRLPPCYRLGQSFGQFIEFVIHKLSFRFASFLSWLVVLFITHFLLLFGFSFAGLRWARVGKGPR
jgi:hypothetical protein